MANMSYCRFENTLRDLRDCFDHVEDTELSVSEQKARSKMLREMYDVVGADVYSDISELEDYIQELEDATDE